MQREDDKILYLDNKEDLSYLVNNYEEKEYSKRAVDILVDLFSVVPKKIYLSVFENENSPMILCGAFCCAHGIVYEFELMRKDLSFRFRISHDEECFIETKDNV